MACSLYANCERYQCTPESLAATLDRYGVACIPGVLTEDECDATVHGVWDAFETITQTWEVPLSRHHPDTWKHIYDLMPSHSMLFQWLIGHCQSVWDVRQNPKVASLFCNLYHCSVDELLVSFDGISFGVPPECTGRGWDRGKSWFHTDQSFTRNEKECVQAWVTAEDVTVGDATLAFYESSHKLHGEFARRFQKTDKANWCQLTHDEESFFRANGCEQKRMTCPKGSIVLWDSRTIHCGIQPLRGRDHPNLRCVVYVCYQPRRMASTKALVKKRKAFQEQRMTSHWPAAPKLFGKTPQHYGKGLPNVTALPDPQLTTLGKKLAGF